MAGRMSLSPETRTMTRLPKPYLFSDGPLLSHTKEKTVLDKGYDHEARLLVRTGPGDVNGYGAVHLLLFVLLAAVKLLVK